MAVRRSDVYADWEEDLARGWIKFMNATNVTVYETSEGRVAGSIPSGTPLMLLTTTRDNKKPHTVTVVYLDGPTVGQPRCWFVVGSNGGLSTPPAWAGHLGKRPSATVQIGRDRWDAQASEVTDATVKADVLTALAEGYRPFADYQARAAGADKPREIKVFKLEPLRRRA
jgi:hypothetical protein